jgi:phytol kinase
VSAPIQAAIWLGILVSGVAFCVIVRRLGMPATYVRDFLHVGAGVWPLGWRWWPSPVGPIAIVAGALVGTTLVPTLSRQFRSVAAVRDSVSGGDERWTGLIAYVASFGVFTWLGLEDAMFPAAAALLALALGDGTGGAVGRRFGKHRFKVPWGKEKSLEGSLAVAALTAVGVLVAAAWFQAPVTLWSVVATSVAVSVMEALSPRASDNVIVPATAWVLLRLTT